MMSRVLAANSFVSVVSVQKTAHHERFGFVGHFSRFGSMSERLRGVPFRRIAHECAALSDRFIGIKGVADF
jgi:hypothetical protein